MIEARKLVDRIKSFFLMSFIDHKLAETLGLRAVEKNRIIVIYGVQDTEKPTFIDSKNISGYTQEKYWNLEKLHVGMGGHEAPHPTLFSLVATIPKGTNKKWLTLNMVQCPLICYFAITILLSMN